MLVFRARLGCPLVIAAVATLGVASDAGARRPDPAESSAFEKVERPAKGDSTLEETWNLASSMIERVYQPGGSPVAFEKIERPSSQEAPRLARPLRPVSFTPRLSSRTLRRVRFDAPQTAHFEKVARPAFAKIDRREEIERPEQPAFEKVVRTPKRALKELE